MDGTPIEGGALRRRHRVMEPYTGTAYHSQEPCCRCGGNLLRLEPPVQGSWRYYCPACQHLTVPRPEAERAMREKPPDAIGVVVAVPFPLVLHPSPEQA